MLTSLKEKIKRTSIWKWGAGTSKNGWNAIAYLTLFAFAFYGQWVTHNVAEDSAQQAESAAEFVQEVTTKLNDLVYDIQLSDYEGCLRAVANQASVKDYNEFLLNRAIELGLEPGDAETLFKKNEELFIPPSTCEQPPPRTVPEVPESAKSDG